MKQRIGKKFGKLTPIKIVQRLPLKYLCRCDCGKEKIISSKVLPRIKSCGCSRITHGFAKYQSNSRNKYVFREYKIWIDMNSNNPTQVCNRWKKSIISFVNDMGNAPVGHSIKRIDPTKKFMKSNCKWVPRKQRIGRDLMVTYKGKTKSLIEWSRETGLSRNALYHRIVKLNFTIKKAFNTPLNHR